MTVYSGIIAGQNFKKNSGRSELTRNNSVAIAFDGLGKFNLILAILAVSLIIFYIFISNFVVSQKYALNVNELELGGVSAELATETYGRITQPTITEVLDYAQGAGMVEAKISDSMIEDTGLAIYPQNVR